MKTIKIVVTISVLLALLSCGEKESEKEGLQKIIIVPTEYFKYNIEAYKIRCSGNIYLLLSKEEQFHDILIGYNIVKDTKDYFSRKKELMKTPPEFDPTFMVDYKWNLVFPDSADKILVNKWVKKIEGDTANLHKPILIDSTVSLINKNNIYYRLICDSFKIYEHDVSGYYILSK